ncbi:hypothetical protein F7725_027871, partial [Dissostichus mawsoni]
MPTNTSQAQPQPPITTSNTSFSDESLTHEIKHLKPCTEYEHDVAFIDAVGKETPCSSIPQTNTNKTNKLSKDDIEDGSCMPGHLFTINVNNISAEPCKNENCIKPRYNDICTNLTTTFTSGNCANAFSLTRSITADFLNPSEINQTSPTKLPAEKEPDLPPNCKNLKITYSCQKDGKPNELKNLIDLEPYTDYSCTGQITDNNVTIKTQLLSSSGLTVVREKSPYLRAMIIKITMEKRNLKMSIKEPSVTNTSIGLSWTTASEKCAVVLPEPPFYYECSCDPPKSKPTNVAARLVKNPSGGISGGTCQIDELKPDTVYNCAVHPKYNNNREPALNNVKRTRTKIGVPGEIKNLKVDRPEHNFINATCDHPTDFNGPGNYYIARLYGGVLNKTLTQTKCEFEFKDLSYSTKYELKVTAFNGYYESIPSQASVTTS